MTPDIFNLESNLQRLQIAPSLGGAVTAWDWKSDGKSTPLWRAWDGLSDDRYTLACFPLIPWSNRITNGGIESNGRHLPIRQNRVSEPYPIHGDGWLQEWKVASQDTECILLQLNSRHFDDNPYEYRGTQEFNLLPDGLAIELSVTHLGEQPLPYGLGLHPYFVRNNQTRLQFNARGVWMSGPDPIPIGYTSLFPEGWDFNQTMTVEGAPIDNCYNGWDGVARIAYPDRGLTLTMQMADSAGYTLLYRPTGLTYFCLEPITHPIDAFHMEGQPGLTYLKQGESLRLRASFRVSETDEGLNFA